MHVVHMRVCVCVFVRECVCISECWCTNTIVPTQADGGAA